MKLIRTITNKDFDQPDADESAMRPRSAARAVILDSDDNVALITVHVGSYHKIPGGGLEDGEDAKVALHREVKEEGGVSVDILDELGYTLEYRDGLKQYSYGYLCRLKSDKGKPEFTKKEQRDGFQHPEWLPIDQAIEICKKDEPEFLRAHFMSLRDRLFLEEAKKILDSKAK
jgi:8-oxo-dGTP pyrophosphatase MutT (NUDIX family)